MAYFPMFVELEGSECIIIGGGEIAYRKAEALLAYGSALTVIAPSFSVNFRTLKQQVTLREKSYEEGDIDRPLLVIVATDDTVLNQQLSEYCKNKNIPVNVVDEKEHCSFLFPSLVKKGEISIGISTGGNSPVIAKWLRKRISEVVTDDYAILAQKLGDIREFVKKKISGSKQRSHIFYELAEQGIKNGGELKEDVINKVMRQYEQDNQNRK